MSRCFSFPPPGYVLNGLRDEAMIVSIKGAEEKAKKEQRKERKRDKKERKDKKDKESKDKKDKKDKKRKKREGEEGESEKRSHKRRHKDLKDGSSQKVDLFRELKEREIDYLDKSSLTVEHDLFQSTSQNSCDSTLNSNEILPKQTLDGRHNNDSESIIRIRLPNRRQKDPEVMITSTDHEKPSPSRGIKLDSSQVITKERVIHPCSTSTPEHASRPREEKGKDPVFSTKVNKEKISLTSTSEARQPSSLCRICSPSMAVQFLNVVENWVPNTIEKRVEDLTNLDDEECWWFMKQPTSHRFDTEKCKQLNINNEIKQVSSSMVWPFARLLQEADVYALPYAVPF